MKRSAAGLARAFALSCALGIGLVMAGTAHAGPPPVQGQAPGWYRMMLGSFEITALSDGTVKLPVDQLLKGMPQARIQQMLARNYLQAPLETSVNGYLVNTGSKLVLIDVGAAGLFGPTLGKLVANLKASGYTPEQVDEIYITHMHPDHVGGLVDSTGGAARMVFPNATVRADAREQAFWLSQANLDAAPEASKGFFQGARASLNPYVAAGRFKPFDGDTELVPGIRAIATRGHTPGHANYVVESAGQRLVVWGDLMHVAAVQFEEPAVTIDFDTDPKAAAPQRKKAFAAAARQGHFVAVAHVAFPGIGQLRADGKGYRWLPANYRSVP